MINPPAGACKTNLCFFSQMPATSTKEHRRLLTAPPLVNLPSIFRTATEILRIAGDLVRLAHIFTKRFSRTISAPACLCFFHFLRHAHAWLLLQLLSIELFKATTGLIPD